MSMSDGVTVANEIKKIFLDEDTIINAKIINKYKQWAYSTVYRITTTATVIPSALHPDAEWRNTRKDMVILKDISIVPNASFKTKGMIQILVNDSVVLDIPKAATLTDISEYVVKLDKVVRQDYSVKILTWTSDGTSSAVTVALRFCEA